ncbi:MAG: TauD/TfdA family dioxygenase [Alphaproteobacteria bacterium]|nr:TauD/TfdA family dioxygenase [Alphaproteobacteria bacterium]
MAITVHRLDDALGAEVRGVDLAQNLDATTFAAIHAAFLEHLVLVFRDQQLPPDRHIAFTRRFGQPEIHILEQFHLPGHHEMLVLSNKKRPDGSPIGLEDAGRYWHTDVSFWPVPSLGSLLYAIEVPPEDGDTWFANQYQALIELPTDLRIDINGRRALHALNRLVAPKFTDEQLARVVPVPHPIVRIHPETGRRALYAGAFAMGVDGMAATAAKTLLDRLYRHCGDDRFVYRHRWRVGDLVMWDNRCVLHHATSFDPRHTRHMHRTTVVGSMPV